MLVNGVLFVKVEDWSLRSFQSTSIQILSDRHCPSLAEQGMARQAARDR